MLQRCLFFAGPWPSLHAKLTGFITGIVCLWNSGWSYRQWRLLSSIFLEVYILYYYFLKISQQSLLFEDSGWQLRDRTEHAQPAPGGQEQRTAFSVLVLLRRCYQRAEHLYRGFHGEGRRWEVWGGVSWICQCFQGICFILFCDISVFSFSPQRHKIQLWKWRQWDILPRLSEMNV